MNNSLKAVNRTDDELVVENYIFLFGNEDSTDLDGDFFTKSTKWKSSQTSIGKIPIDWEHGFYTGMGEPADDEALGYVDMSSAKADDKGLFVQRVLNRRNHYIKTLDELGWFDNGMLGNSSEANPRLVSRTQKANTHHITRWPLIGDTLTVYPREPRMLTDNQIQSIKSAAAIIPTLKSLIPEDGGTPSEDSETEADDTQAVEININLNVGGDGSQPTASNEDTNMSTKDEAVQDDVQEEVQEEAPVTVQFDTEALASELKAAVVAPLLERIEALEAQPVETTHKAAPNIKRVTKAGFSNDQVETFKHWIRTGDEVAAKAALQEGTDAEGGYLVPEDMLTSIIEKRDEMSILRQAGVQTFTTSRDRFDIPVESAKMSNFAITAEEAAYDQNEPTFNEVAVSIYKFTKLVKISEELSTDEGTGLDAYLSRAFGRAWGLTENQYGLVGTGSGQPQGVFVGGTAGVTAASATAIAASEVPALYYKLGQQYRDQAVWVSSGTTEGTIRSLQGDDWLFANSPQGAIDGSFWARKPLYTSESVADIATGNKSLVVGNFNYYGLVTRQNLTISRNPYLYEANGQIGIFAKVRMGGAVLQAEAFQYLTQA